jgi:hypothetical protein
MSAIIENKTFEERMKDRIKDSIGDLITDEDLTKLVNRGIDDVFFKKVVVRDGYRDQKELPSLMESIVKELLQEKVRLFALEYVRAHEKEVLETLDKVVIEGAGKAVLAALTGLFQNQLYSLQANIQSQFQNGGFK